MIYPIVVFGDPILKKRAVDISENNPEIQKLVSDMFETMYEANGVGLAAPQIGKGIRLFVVDAEPLDKEKLKGFKKVFINPEILEESGEEWGFEEGCLSITGIRTEVKRHANVKLKYLDENFVEHIEDFDGFKARVIQHEYDHLEGVLFVDLVSPIKKQLIRSKLTNISRGKVDADYRVKLPTTGRR